MDKKAFEKSLDQVINVPYEKPGPEEIGPEETMESMPSAKPDLQPTCNQLAKDANVPCKDTIYRQDAIDMIMGQPPEAHYPSWYAEQIKALPSAEPEQINPCTICQEFDCYGCKFRRTT